MIRETIANSLIAAGRTIGNVSGLELAVVVSDHSIETTMEQPDESQRAWDQDLYKHGNLFASGYANPIKPQIRYNEELENPNELHVKEGDSDSDTDTETTEHVQLISSGRYREYMRQDLISQLLTPETRWNMLVWAIIAVGVLGFLNMIVTLYATGSFA